MCVCVRRQACYIASWANPNPSLHLCPMSAPVLKVISRSGLSLEKKGEGAVCLCAADAAAGQPNLLILTRRLAASGELSSSIVPIQGI